MGKNNSQKKQTEFQTKKTLNISGQRPLSITICCEMLSDCVGGLDAPYPTESLTHLLQPRTATQPQNKHTHTHTQPNTHQHPTHLVLRVVHCTGDFHCTARLSMV